MKTAADSGGSENATAGYVLNTTTETNFLHAKKRIGGKDAPVNYPLEERVFCSGDTPPDKALARLEVGEMLRSRILSAEKPDWNISNSNWDNMQMSGECYKRTNINAEVRRSFDNK
ncbi:unnamed protein product [Phytophthora fragariaefolia]|uniref:Unnamed protein product n=1 Tax=Phytophthora fragariaefolia TaxID=1490495 RepID=A0A9W6TLL1_9STRA|nr:unnamed protein product [Phytophthora fragariaefolia]